jgi:hypothetical protein
MSLSSDNATPLLAGIRRRHDADFRIRDYQTNQENPSGKQEWENAVIHEKLIDSDPNFSWQFKTFN